jgi:deazaflavin-dependent oxidoreductase (nitroreductase family)
MPMARSLRRVGLAMYRFCYQLTGGAIGGGSAAMPILLLTTTGRKTGRPRTTPLLYVTDGENIVVVASNAGRPRHPFWWLNLQENPEAEVQVRSEKRRVKAEGASGEERKRLPGRPRDRKTVRRSALNASWPRIRSNLGLWRRLWPSAGGRCGGR